MQSVASWAYNMLDTELYWLAGLLEGEGYFGTRSDRIMVRMQTTDEWTAQRAAHLMETNVTGPYRKLGHKPVHSVSVSGTKETVKLIEKLLPLMSPRRQEAMKKQLEMGYSIIENHADAQQKALIVKYLYEVGHLKQSEIADMHGLKRDTVFNVVHGKTTEIGIRGRVLATA